MGGLHSPSCRELFLCFFVLEQWLLFFVGSIGSRIPAFDARRHPRPRCRPPCPPLLTRPWSAWPRADSRPFSLAPSPAASRRCSGWSRRQRRCPAGPASMHYSPAAARPLRAAPLPPWGGAPPRNNAAPGGHASNVHLEGAETRLHPEGAETWHFPPRAAPSAAGDGSPHRRLVRPAPPPSRDLFHPPDLHIFPEHFLLTRSATAAACMAGLDPTAPATDVVYWVCPNMLLWLSGKGPAAVPAERM